jgi:DNA-binding transcriptional regulator YhcF (GntR family)
MTLMEPSGLHVDRKSQLPVHSQLAEQLRHQIISGQLAAGQALPSIRELATYLRINRNTVARTIADLEREGWIETRPGRGAFVVEREPAGAESLRLDAWVDEALVYARRNGLDPEQAALALVARAKAQQATAGKERRRPVLMVECNRREANHFAAELEKAVDVVAEPCLVGEVEQELATGRPWAMVVVPVFHAEEVADACARHGVPMASVMVEASMDLLVRLLELPAGTTVGVACWTEESTLNVRRSVEGPGIVHLRVVEGVGNDDESLREMCRQAKVVVVSHLVADRIREMGFGDVEILTDDRSLDTGGLAMVARLLEQDRAAVPVLNGGREITHAPAEAD